MNVNDISELVKRYVQALESGKNSYFDADEFEALADYYDSQNDIDTAADIINAGLAIHPENTALILQKAKLTIYENKYVQALELLNKISGSYEYELYLLKLECLLNLDSYEEAAELTKELLEKEDDESPDSVFAELGFLYVEADCFTEAVHYFTESLKLNAENMDVLSDLAYAYEMMGNFEDAIDIINKILDIDPYAYEAWINLGKLYSLGDEFEKAIDAFDFALTINDSDVSVLKLKAHCLSLSDRAEEAIEIFKAMLENDAEDTSLYYLLAECYQSVEMYDEALDCLLTYEVKEKDVTAELISKKTYIYLQKEDYETAFETVAEGLATYPQSPDLNILAGGIRFKEGRFAEAEEFYLKAYASTKENYHLLDRLSILSIKKGNYQDAIDYTEKLLELNFSNSALKQRLASLYFELNEEVGFNRTLNTFTDKELQDLFDLIYAPRFAESFDRELLIKYLNEARECRKLFKGIEY